MSGPLNVAVLISGRGSNLQALIGACAGRGFPARIVAVISDVADAPGLAHAEAAGIPAHVAAPGIPPDRAAFEARLQALLESAQANFICLAGFMRVLSPGFVRTWEGRIINIHPSLLPDFKGLNVHEQVLAAGARMTGCTVHFVTADLDGGPAILKAAVKAMSDDTPATLAARVLEAEHRIYPLALKKVALGLVRLENGRAMFGGR